MTEHNCPNCGAPIDLNKTKCAYCGTPYKVDQQNMVLRVERYESPVIPLEFKSTVSNEMIMCMNDAELGGYLRKTLARGLAEHVADAMQIETMPDPIHGCHVVRARVRILRDDYRF